MPSLTLRVSFCVLTSLLLIATYAVGAEQPKGAKSKTAKPAATSDSPVLVRVNGQPITEADLDFFAKTLKITADELPQQREAMLERLIERQLLRAFLAQKKVAADPQRLEAYLTQLKTRLKAKGEDFDKLLAKSGFTEESLRRELKLPLDWDEYARRETTDDKLRDIWKTRKHEFDGSEVRAAQIALKGNNPAADQKKLAEIREEIIAGKLTFAEAAKQHSQAPSATQGGDLGRFGFRGKQPPPYPQISFRLKVGEVSEPVRSPFGVLLLTVTERSDGQLSLEDARPEILQQLSIEMQRGVLSRERVQAKIERQ
jgi:parvulin-like peptidyl-prolyl isomerase